jgi:cytochrome c553
MGVKWAVKASAVALALLAVACSRPEPGPELAWAYPSGKDSVFPVSFSGPQHAPGSAITLTPDELGENPPDWFPEEHPPAPAIVARDRKDGQTPCAECHMIEGQGFPGSADLAGLPAAYIVEQVNAFKSGQRRSAQTDRTGTVEMIKVAQAVGDADLEAAAAYFASLPRRTRIKVVEADSAPKTWPDRFGWLNLAEGGVREPIAGRIIEVPDDPQRLFISDPRVAVIDYVPTGALGRGAVLVRSGGPGGQPCGVCHGPDLKGNGPAPPLAGRGAAYLARMLWDIRSGARNGASVEQMQRPARGLTPAQITDITAYLASLTP